MHHAASVFACCPADTVLIVLSSGKRQLGQLDFAECRHTDPNSHIRTVSGHCAAADIAFCSRAAALSDISESLQLRAPEGG